MKASLPKKQESKLSNTDSRPQNQKSQSPNPLFQDNRPETIQMQKLQETIRNSPQVRLLENIQKIADIASSKRYTDTQSPERQSMLPGNLKSGIENLSGYSMDDVRVHYNSDKPASLNAHALAQGTDIHLASGQEKHLPHEAWHIAQQKQGRVKPTATLNGHTKLNEDKGLEQEATDMGLKALRNQKGSPELLSPLANQPLQLSPKQPNKDTVVQLDRKSIAI